MTWVPNPRSTFMLLTFEKREPPPCASQQTRPLMSAHPALPKSTEQKKISALVMTYDACQPQAPTPRDCKARTIIPAGCEALYGWAGINLAEFQSLVGIHNGFKNDKIVEENMRRPRAANARSTSKITAQSPGKRIYVFRCEGSGLYAFTADREGRMLPSQIYPQITWRFEQALTLRLNGNSSRDQILRATLDSVRKCGFHLIHAALYGELLGFSTLDPGTVH
jgi:hypothetical protein